MKGIVDFLKGSYYEFSHNVTWPKWDELQSSTIIIAVATLILAIFLFAVDTTFTSLIGWFYSKIG